MMLIAKYSMQILASGYASNGKGGIDANEFCESIKTLLFDLVNEHAAAEALLVSIMLLLVGYFDQHFLPYV